MASYDLNKINTSLLKQDRDIFEMEKTRFNNGTYNTFISCYLNNCSDSYVKNMANNLKNLYDVIGNGYKNISNWWSGYNRDIEDLENTLANGDTLNSNTLSYIKNLIDTNLPSMDSYKVISVNGLTFIFDLDNNIIKAYDKDGNPISIFGSYNYDNSQYGGNQNVFISDKELELLFSDKMLEIVKKYYPDIDVNDHDALLDIYHNKLGMMGCGYVAITNSIFKVFEGKEQLFQKTFGYPMYNVNENGQLDFNYEYMIADYYFYNCKNTFGVDFKNITSGLHKLNEKNNPMDFMVSNNGITGSKYILYSYLDDYLKQYGISGTVKKISYLDFNTSDKYDHLTSDGTQIITNALCWRIDNITPFSEDFPYSQYPAKGNIFVSANEIVTNPFTEGHAMYITNVDNDEILVSTWGGSAKINWSPLGLLMSEFVAININID